jgi:hypothetical protein
MMNVEQSMEWLAQFSFIHHRSHSSWSRLETRPPCSETDEWQPLLQDFLLTSLIQMTVYHIIIIIIIIIILLQMGCQPGGSVNTIRHNK